MSFQVGETVGDYEILGVLGKGGMGKVFRVRNLISDRVEAMKVILPDLEANPALADRFLREIKVHAALDHPNIARLQTALRVGNRIVMIMELVDGVGLDEKLRQGPVELAEAVHYMDQVLSALAFAHSHGIIHRDMKPANIIVTAAGLVKITDFGIARAAGGPSLTMAGMALGSLYYMSPEQVKAGPVDARSDLYSLGVTFYQVVTGRRPIDGDSEYSIMNAQLAKVPVPPVEVNPGLPPPVSALIMKALEKEPAQRFQTALDFQSALRRMAETTSLRLTLPAAGAAAGGSGTLAAAIDPAELAGLESRLLPVLGPIARHLVAREARHASTLSELCRSLAGHIPGDREREAFVGSCAGDTASRTAATPGAAPPPPAHAAAVPWDPALLETLKQKLAPFVGPIAKVVVERAARRVNTQEDLYRAVAAEVEPERDRQAFLASLPR